MANTKAVNFRADAMFYQKTKEVLADQKISVSDVLNATLRKIANGTVDPEEFVSSDLQDKQYQVAFEDLKKEILVGHIGGLVAGLMLAYVFPVRGEARFMNRTYQISAALSYLLLLLYFLGKILNLF